jgi:hypothetical protein
MPLIDHCLWRFTDGLYARAVTLPAFDLIEKYPDCKSADAKKEALSEIGL